MPQIAPILSVVLSAAGTAYGANQQRKAGKAAKRRWDAMQPDVDFMRQQGRDMATLGREGQERRFGYLSDLASGSTARLMQQIGPDLKQLGNNMAQQRQNIMQFAPRGGGAAALAAQNPMALAEKQQDIKMAARDNAMEQLGTLGGQMRGQGVNTVNSALSGQTNVNNGLNQADIMNAQAGEMYGQAMGQLIGGIDWNSLFTNAGASSIPAGQSLTGITGMFNQNLPGVAGAGQGTVMPLNFGYNSLTALNGLAPGVQSTPGAPQFSGLADLIAALYGTGYRPGRI